MGKAKKVEEEVLDEEVAVEEAPVKEPKAAKVEAPVLPDVRPGTGKFEVVSDEEGNHRGYNERGQAVTPVVQNLTLIAKDMKRAEVLRISRQSLKEDKR